LKQDTQTTDGRVTTVKWFVAKGFVKQPQQQTEFIKPLTNLELLKQFNNFKLNGYKQDITHLLMRRGVDSEFINKNSLLI
jgi:hypothetical protein